MLRDEAEAFAQKLHETGVEVQCVRYNGAIHAYAALAGGVHLGREALADAVDFLRRFPRSFLAKDDEQSNVWRKSYIKTFIEQDIPNFGFQIPSPQLRRFWMMLTHNHGNIFNASEIGNSLQLTYKTIQNY